MLLRLAMPYIDKRVQGGTIVKWHKKEGDWVHYGDDLLDMDVAEMIVLSRPSLPQQISRSLNNPRTTVRQVGTHELLRITSSDMGILRRIYAKEGTRCEAGDLLSILTTEETEPFDETSEAIKKASQFRVVANTP